MANYYNEKLNSLNLEIKTPVIVEGATHVYQMYTIQVPIEKRDKLVFALKEKVIGASVHFDPPVHLQQYYRENYMINKLPNTELLSNSLITLPMYPTLSFADQDKVCQALSEILGEKLNV